MVKYEPTMGQAIFGSAWGEYEMPRYANVLFAGIWERLSRVFWNINQRQMESDGSDDPRIDGIVVRRYCWEEDTPAALLPNFTFDGLEIRWYKHPGRDMSVNYDWTPDQWVAWFNKIMAAIDAADGF